jgi:carboxymethylenebutenolidase
MKRACGFAMCLALAAVRASAQTEGHGPHAMGPPAAGLLSGVPQTASSNPDLPADEAHAAAALESSPRHGEWVEIPVPGTSDKVKSFVVYPERPDKAPVVIVIQEIFGLTDWIRGVADQLAREGFIAIAPDFLSGKGPGGGGTQSLGDRARQVNSGLPQAEVLARVNAAREYGVKLPAATGKSAVIGFCWGGGMAFDAALMQPAFNAAVTYYGPMPNDPAAYGKARTPVLGLYGENDARVNANIPAAEAEMKKHGAPYQPVIYPGAGHGFLRQLDGQGGANLKAAERAWPLTLGFLRKHTS